MYVQAIMPEWSPRIQYTANPVHGVPWRPFAERDDWQWFVRLPVVAYDGMDQDSGV